MNLIIGILLSLIAQTITFFQLQGPLRYELFRNHKMIVASFGMLTSYLYIYSVQYITAYYNGQTWPCRLIGFGIGVILFSALAYTFFGESISLKTGVCLLLALAIITIQIFWK